MKQTHIPRDPNQRINLIESLQQKLLNTNKDAPQAHIKSNGEDTIMNDNNQLSYKDKETIKLRIKLIADCTQLSVERITHLQQIFKHYCTHIFKTGKHMTFERLEYEKIHITLDRFCIFLKDFHLTTALIEGTIQQVIDKNQIIRNFKRISKNCRDLSFEEFIACLEKLSISYYDEKEIHWQKMEKFKKDRLKRIADYRKKMKEKEKQKQQLNRFIYEQRPRVSAVEVDNSDQPTGVNFYEKQQNNKGTNTQKSPQKLQNKLEQKGSKIIQKLQNNVSNVSNIQNMKDDLNSSLVNISGIKQQGSPKNQNKQNKQKPVYLQLTSQQKIQYYYQLIGVDNAQDFKNKMSQLNLPIFRSQRLNQKLNNYATHKRSTSTKNQSQLTSQNHEQLQTEQRRLIQLRQKLNSKRERQKHIRTKSKITKQQYERLKRQRQQRRDQVNKQQSMVSYLNGMGKLVTKDIRDNKDDRNKIQIMSKQLSLDELNGIKFKDLRIKFDPKKFGVFDDNDSIFLEQYGAFDQNKSYRLKQRIMAAKQKQKNLYKMGQKVGQSSASFLQRKRTTSQIIGNVKKRVQQLQIKQVGKQAKLAKHLNQLRKRQKNSNLDNY